MNLFKLTIIFFLVVTLQSCSQKDLSLNNKLLSGSIINGTTTNNFNQEHPASFNTVALVYKKEKIYCTGSIISKRFILTAKHCVAGKETSNIQIFFGNKDKFLNSKPLIDTKNITLYADPNFINHFPNHDIALLELEQDIPPTHKALPILQDSNLLKNNTSLELVGFGDRDPDHYIILAGEKLSLKAHVEKYLNEPFFKNLIIVKADQENSGVCYGDSGGPAYIKIGDQWHITGIVNGIDSVLTPDAMEETGDDIFSTKAKCEMGDSVYTFPGAYQKWIEHILNHIPHEYQTYHIDNIPNPDSFTSWCKNVNPHSPSWITMRSLMYFASDFRSKDESLRDIFSNCERAAEILSLQDEIFFSDYYPYASLDPLRSLTNIKSINITSSPIDIRIEELNFAALNSMTALESLHIIDLNIKSTRMLRVLADHQNLKTLDLSNNQLEDLQLESIASISLLQQLDLSRNSISDISALSKLTNLKIINLSGNKISDLTPLQKIKDIKKVLASNNKIDSIIGIANFNSLLNLDLSSNNIKDLNFLKATKNNCHLKTLILSNNQIKNLEGIEHCHALEELMLYDNQIEDISSLKDLNQIINLNLGDNSIYSIDELFGEEIKNLEKLYLQDNYISSIKALKTFKLQIPNLRHLVIRNNSISDLSPLNELSSLEHVLHD